MYVYIGPVLFVIARGKAHMGQFPKDGENGQNVAFVHFFGALL